MHPTLEKAIRRAEEILDQAMASATSKAQRLSDLEAMTHAELVAIVAEHEGLHKSGVKIGETCADILCDPDCSWLTYEMIHALLLNRVPEADTTVKNIIWYSSHYMNERGRDVQVRKPKKEINKLLLRG